jgi:4-amino-4-deoxy-L-arabinose transferase-like glycosyltransferase
LRILWWAYAKPVPVSDFEEYRLLAEGLLKNSRFGILKPSAYLFPGYPFFLAFIITIHPSVEWLSLVNVILSTLMTYILYKLSLSLTSNTSLSLVAALIYAINPTFILFSPVLASEHLYSVLLFSAFLILGRDQTKISSHPIRKYLLSGILFGLAILTRGEGVFFLPIFLGMSYSSTTKNGNRYMAVLITLIAIVLVIAPWYMRNYYIVGPGSGLSTSSGLNFYYAHNENQYGGHSLKGTDFEDMDEVQRQKFGYKLGFEYLTTANLQKIAKDISVGTSNLYFSTDYYALYWSTRIPSLESDTPNPSKQLKGIYEIQKVLQMYFFLALSAILSLLFVRHYPLKVCFFLFGIVIMNWIGYAWIFWAKARYRYTSEIVFCVLSALFFYEIINYFQHHLITPKKKKRGEQINYPYNKVAINTFIIKLLLAPEQKPFNIY